MDQTEFLTARYDEDEAQISESEAYGGAGCALPGLHLDPQRARRDVKGKRAILAMHQPQPFWGNNPPPRAQQTDANVVAWFCECQCPDGVIEAEWPCETVAVLMADYAGHPDFDPAQAVPGALTR